MGQERQQGRKEWTLCGGGFQCCRCCCCCYKLLGFFFRTGGVFVILFCSSAPIVQALQCRPPQDVATTHKDELGFYRHFWNILQHITGWFVKGRHYQCYYGNWKSNSGAHYLILLMERNLSDKQKGMCGSERM